MLTVSPVFGQTSNPDSTGVGTPLTSSGVVSSVPIGLTQLIVKTDGSNSVTVAVYNNTAASGDEVTEWVCSGAANVCGQDWRSPRYCGKGLYVSITTSGSAKVFTEYQYR